MKILVVDANDDLCRLTVDIMRDAGHEADCASTITKAEYFLDAVPYDVVYIDHWLLKTQNGYKLLHKVKGSIVVLSSLNDPEKYLKGVKYHRLLKKPFSLEDLLKI